MILMEPRIGEQKCFCGNYKPTYARFCGGFDICKTKQASDDRDASIERERLNRKIELITRNKQIKLDEKTKLIKKVEADKKRKIRLNTEALRLVLQNEENERDHIAEQITKLDPHSDNAVLLDQLTRKYKAAIRKIKRTQGDLNSNGLS